MRFFSVRRLALPAFFLVLAACGMFAGCSNQGEGDRCGPGTDVPVTTADNADCEDGLICTRLGIPGQPNNRCCYPAPRAPTNSRCIATAVATGGAGNAGSSGVAGGSGIAGASGNAGGSGSVPEAGAAGATADVADGG